MEIAGCICFVHKSYILHKQRLNFASLSPADFLDTKKVCSHDSLLFVLSLLSPRRGWLVTSFLPSNLYFT